MKGFQSYRDGSYTNMPLLKIEQTINEFFSRTIEPMTIKFHRASLQQGLAKIIGSDIQYGVLMGCISGLLSIIVEGSHWSHLIGFSEKIVHVYHFICC